MKRLWRLCLTLGVTALLFGALTVSASAYLPPMDYEIDSEQEFLDFAAEVNEGDEYENCTVMLTADLDFTGLTFVPVGAEYAPFAGNFDGGGHTISGIEYENVEANDVGVFGRTYAAEIYDLNVADCSITGRGHVGGVVGFAGNSTIWNCGFDGTVTGDAYVGGIAGNLYGETSLAQISNCFSAGTVSGAYCVGGITGTAEAYYGTVEVSNCYSAAAVTAQYSCAGGVAGVGGGSEDNKIRYCYYKEDSATANYDVSANTPQNGIGADSGTAADVWDATNGYQTTSFDASTQAVAPGGLPEAPVTLLDALNAWVSDQHNDSRKYRFWTASPDVNSGLPVFAKYWTDAAMRDDTFLAGDTIPETIEVATPAQLGRLAYLRNKAIDQLNLSGKTVTLTADIDLSGALWVPIGSFSSAAFDGQEHSITNMDVRTGDITRFMSDTKRGPLAGLFARAGGEIKNLSLSGCVHLSYTGGGSVGTVCAGGLAGCVIGAHIENVYADVDVTVRNSAADAEVIAGGLVGIMAVASKTILNCSAVGDVTATNTAAGGTVMAGGLLGLLQDSTLRNSYYNGCLTASGESEGAAGGLSGGFSRSTADNCYAAGTCSTTGDSLVKGAVAGAANSSAFTNVYYETELCAQAVGYGTADGAAAITTADALLTALNAVAQGETGVEESYSEWAIGIDLNGGLPVFGTQVPPAPPAPSGSSSRQESWVAVDGKKVNVGKVTVRDGVTTTQVNQNTLAKQIASANENVTVIVPERTSSMSAGLVVKNLDELTEKQMSLTVQAGDVNYELPAAAVDTAQVLQELGITDPILAPLKITVARPSVDELIEQRTKELEEKAQREFEENYRAAFEQKLVMPPLSFDMTASYEGKVTPIERFDTYVPRTVSVTEAEAARITTAVVFEQDGTMRHVPTEVFAANGKWYAKINSRTNSDYLLITDDSSFADAAGTWYEAIVTEMAQRQVVAGRDTGAFDGNTAVTRAELAAMLVKALGLPAGGSTTFRDVPDDAWFSGAVGAAVEYGLVCVYADGTFRPDETVTRQDAMLILRQAARVAGYPTDLLNARNVADEFSDLDTVSDYAAEGMYWNLFNSFFVGSNGLVRPREDLTRAEAATVALRLLQRAGLVDVRTP